MKLSIPIDGVSIIQKFEEEEHKYYSENPSIATTYMRNRPPSYDQNISNLEISMSNQSEDDSAFTVGDPVIGSHVTYMVKGIDNDGQFEGLRRYNDFFNLRTSLL